MRPFWIIDKPNIFEAPDDEALYEVKGWIASLGRIDELRCADPEAAERLRFSFSKRPDVEEKFPDLTVTGFYGSCTFDAVSGLEYLKLELETGGKSYEVIAPIHPARRDAEARRNAKMKKLYSRLQCPICGGSRKIVLRDSFNTIIDRVKCKGPGHRPGLMARLVIGLLLFPPIAALLRLIRSRHLKRNQIEFSVKNFLICPRCLSAALFDKKHYNYLADGFIEEFGIQPTGNVSDNQYDGLAFNYIHKYRNGLILDCGAGMRKHCYENVVNFEIVHYDSTDVLGVAEKLPFKDNTFDAIFSFAVIEHVKEPFAAASEMIRVLKPGGSIYCQIPFLAPLHGYPNHYFNMSRQGFSRLFEGLVDVEELNTLNFGQPIFTLSWFLNSYSNGLPPELRESFKETKIGDWLEPGSNYLGRPFIRHLSEEAQETLSCVNYMLATKKRAGSA